MFIEPTITWVPSGFSGYIWLDTKIVLKKEKNLVITWLRLGSHCLYFLCIILSTLFYYNTDYTKDPQNSVIMRFQYYYYNVRLVCS